MSFLRPSAEQRRPGGPNAEREDEGARRAPCASHEARVDAPQMMEGAQRRVVARLVRPTGRTQNALGAGCVRLGDRDRDDAPRTGPPLSVSGLAFLRGRDADGRIRDLVRERRGVRLLPGTLAAPLVTRRRFEPLGFRGLGDYARERLAPFGARAEKVLTGGCLPLDLLAHVAPEPWRIRHHDAGTCFGVASEVLVTKRQEIDLG